MKYFNFIALAAIAALTVSSSLFAQDAEPKLTVAKPVAKATMSSKARPLSVNVSLHSDTKISGTLTSETSTLNLQSSFGAIDVPLSEVAGIRFASAEDASTTVVMLNGDSITGATDMKIINVETEWGSATINGPTISSILFVPGLAWSATSGMNGKRWQLLSNKPSAPSSGTPTRNVSTPIRSSNVSPPQPSRIFRTR